MKNIITFIWIWYLSDLTSKWHPNSRTPHSLFPLFRFILNHYLLRWISGIYFCFLIFRLLIPRMFVRIYFVKILAVFQVAQVLLVVSLAQDCWKCGRKYQCLNCHRRSLFFLMFRFEELFIKYLLFLIHLLLLGAFFARYIDFVDVGLFVCV